MKIDYVSDVHANHWIRWTQNQMKWESRTRQWTRKLLENGSGEVLVMAGDFSEWNIQTFWVLDEAAKHYERVYYTFGNHDLYLLSKKQKKKYGDSMGRLNELIELASSIPNVVPLIKSIDEYKGVRFAGDAMWYLPNTPEDWSFYQKTSFDSAEIHIRTCFSNEIPVLLHRQSMEWYETLENETIDIFVSHVPPIHNPYSYEDFNSCYVTQPPFIHVPHWICGHQHVQRDFQRKGLDVEIHMNPIGYPSEYSHYKLQSGIPEGDIDEEKSFGVKTFEVKIRTHS